MPIQFIWMEPSMPIQYLWVCAWRITIGVTEVQLQGKSSADEERTHVRDEGEQRIDAVDAPQGRQWCCAK